MATFTETRTETFHVISCAWCGANFGITSQLHKRAATEGRGHVYCCSCGKENCWNESEAQKQIRNLKSQLDSAIRRADTASRRADMAEDSRQHVENQLRATKGVVTKIKKRVSKGVCPCCNRSFENLKNHMESQHPEYV